MYKNTYSKQLPPPFLEMTCRSHIAIKIKMKLNPRFSSLDWFTISAIKLHKSWLIYTNGNDLHTSCNRPSISGRRHIQIIFISKWFAFADNLWYDKREAIFRQVLTLDTDIGWCKISKRYFQKDIEKSFQEVIHISLKPHQFFSFSNISTNTVTRDI